ncbi:hypothetical protein RO21_11165 [[Actinobacillus] muris]|uniref:HEPN domain-containing protein n=1 Tax=Muribacter muris TaxID=67855 RepID=A0A0J5S113_9PAST|nr:hypothetical protein [Muribacter muris]KMK50547.1 hypothetical protein RO21_11165 [[Actinobacillus] muris] [Muribacter muris]
MITPDDLIQKSNEFSTQTEEIYWRESTRLAYYAVYHKLQQFATQNSIDLLKGKGGVHKKAISSIQHYSDTGRDLAYYMDRMKKQRVIADYYLTDNFLQEDAENQQATMQTCLGYLSQL